jgi:alpha-D-ribose 1-methylphosphonate 5-triphosphate synthase subunit PhnI
MVYVAVKGGERAIDASLELLAKERRGDPSVPEISLRQISDQLALSVDRVMTEGSLYDRELAALAIKQARGDLIEAIFLLRAYRTTLPRFGALEPLDTGRCDRRRVSATYKDMPGGQVLGPTFDYTHRLLDFALAADAGGRSRTPRPKAEPQPPDAARDRLLGARGLIERERDGSMSPATSRASRWPSRRPRPAAAERWRAATRASCSRSAIRRSAAMAAPIPSPARSASARSRWSFVPEDSASPSRSATSPSPNARWSTSSRARPTEPPQFTRGYGLVFGHASARRCRWRWSTARCARGELGEERRRRRRTRNSCSRIPTMCRRPASSST